MADPTSNKTRRSSDSFKKMIEATKTPFIFNAQEEGTSEEVFFFFFYDKNTIKDIQFEYWVERFL